MELLDAVNRIMPKLNERPVTSVTQKHPTLAILLPIIDNARRQLLMQKWWFNAYNYEAFPDPSKHIYMGLDVISFTPKKPGVVVRGKRLYNLAERTYEFNESVKGEVVEDLEFDLLPESAAQAVFYCALVEMFTTDIGMSKELALWAQQEEKARTALLSEHLRQKKHSTRKLPAWRRMEGARRV